jgi:hypothetical protein
MPTRRYEQREPTHDWKQIRPLLTDPTQFQYEIIRPKSRSRKIATHNVNREPTMTLVVLRENTYPYHFFDERNVDHEGTTSTPSQN